MLIAFFFPFLIKVYKRGKSWNIILIKRTCWTHFTAYTVCFLHANFRFLFAALKPGTGRTEGEPFSQGKGTHSLTPSPPLCMSPPPCSKDPKPLWSLVRRKITLILLHGSFSKRPKTRRRQNRWPLGEPAPTSRDPRGCKHSLRITRSHPPSSPF